MYTSKYMSIFIYVSLAVCMLHRTVLLGNTAILEMTEIVTSSGRKLRFSYLNHTRLKLRIPLSKKKKEFHFLSEKNVILYPVL